MTVIWKQISSASSDRFREQLERCQWEWKLTSGPEGLPVYTVNHLFPVAHLLVVCDEAIDQTVGYVIFFGQSVLRKGVKWKPIA